MTVLRYISLKSCNVFWYIILLISFQLLFGSTSVHADIYKCELNGQPYFTGQPCGGVESKVIRRENPEEAAARAAVKRLKEDADLFERQLRIVVSELDAGNYWRAKQHAHDYGIDFDRVHAQWVKNKTERRAQRAASRSRRARRIISDPALDPMYSPSRGGESRMEDHDESPGMVTDCDAQGCYDTNNKFYWRDMPITPPVDPIENCQAFSDGGVQCQ